MAPEIRLRLYEELNDYLPPERKKREVAYPLEAKTSIGQILESLNVPASEVEFVLVNGSSVDLSYFLSAGDRVSIYPVFESFDVTPLLRLRVEPLRQIRFIVDMGLPRLAFYLRLLGFDAFAGDPARLEEGGGRILLTRNATLSNSGLSRIFVIRGETPRMQLKEVLCRFDLLHSAHFSWLQSKLARLLAR